MFKDAFKEIKLKRKIKAAKAEIVRIERKRIRSQSALVQAILTKSSPSDADVDYFNQYSGEIAALRREIADYELQLNGLSSGHRE